MSNIILFNGWKRNASHSRSVTVDHNKVQSADQTDFPVLFNGTYTYLKTIANGGKVQNSSGFDIQFCTNPSNVAGTRLSWEMTFYDPTTGIIEAWIKVPTLTTGSDYVFYVTYGDATIVSFQGGSTGAAWNSGYQGVYHFKDGTTLGLLDSTSHGVNGTNNGATATAGQIDGGIAFSGSSQWVNMGNNLGFIGDFTIEAWVHPTDFSGFNGIISKTAGNQPKPYDYYLIASTGVPRLIIGDGSGNAPVDATSATTAGVWNHIAAVKTGTNTITHYLNGVANGSGNATGAPNPLINGTDNALIATRGDNVTMFKGSMDEVRVSNVALTANWLKTQYNNHNSPSTFYTIGSEV